MSGHPMTDAAGNEFTPSATFSTEDGRREVALVFIGDSFVAGEGDDKALGLSLIHISEPTRQCCTSRMPSSA